LDPENDDNVRTYSNALAALYAPAQDLGIPS
jgi:hypothetical protein